jgi:hypothetical protein
MTVSRHRLIHTLTGTACLFGLTSMSAENVPATWTFLGLVALSGALMSALRTRPELVLARMPSPIEVVR